MKRHFEVVDQQGEGYTVDLVCGSELLSVFLAWREIPVAYAHLALRDDYAELCDILVKVDVVTKYSLLRQCLGCVETRSFRGKGLGTQLLTLTIEAASRRGTNRIVGKMVGDLARLTPWYQSFGFVVQSDGEHIELVIKPRSPGSDDLDRAPSTHTNR